MEEEHTGLGDDDCGGLDEMLDDVQAFIDNQEDLAPYRSNDVPQDSLDGLRVNPQHELYPGCKFFKFEFIVKFLHLKVYNKWSNKSFNMILQLL